MLTPEKLEENRLQSLKVCEQSYLMYEETKKEMKTAVVKKVDNNGVPVYSEQVIKNNLELLETAQKDIVDKYIQLGGKEEDLKNLKKSTKKIVDRKALGEIMKKETAKDEMAAYIANMRANDVKTEDEQASEAEINEAIQAPYKYKESVFEVGIDNTVPDVNELARKTQKTDTEIKEKMVETEKLQVSQPNTETYTPGNKQMYDIINLPSRGQCYRNKKGKIKVSYLTAYDENMILSPNLYKDGNFIDYLLKAKVFEEDVDVEELTKGDRDAIILWLRATGYGNDYPIVVTDDETGKEFETSVDLSTINYKPFKLKGDVNGYFDFVMPKSKDIIKFKFLTVKDLNLLNKLKVEENKKLKVSNIKQLCSTLMDETRDTDLISQTAQQKIRGAVELVREEITKNYDEENDLSFSHELTDRLLLQTVSINGITDRKYIENYIFSMNVRDAAAYRKYVLDNEPGVDFNIEVQRPESLGGGSIKSFLRLDQFVFINV